MPQENAGVSPSDEATSSPNGAPPTPQPEPGNAVPRTSDQLSYTEIRQNDIVLIQSGHRSAGIITTYNRVYLLDTDEKLTSPNGAIRITRPKGWHEPKEAKAQPTQGRDISRDIGNSDSAKLGKRIIKLAVFYSRDSLAAQDDHSFISLVLERVSNWVFWRNRINIRIEIKSLGINKKTSAKTANEELRALQTNDRLREEVRSSLQGLPHVVAWLGKYNKEGGRADPCGGILHSWGCPSFIIADTRATLEQFTLLHELGHLLGLDHEKGNTSGCPKPDDARAFLSSRYCWHTIMGDPDRTWIDTFLGLFGIDRESVALPIWSGSGIEYPGEDKNDTGANNAKYLRDWSQK